MTNTYTNLKHKKDKTKRREGGTEAQRADTSQPDPALALTVSSATASTNGLAPTNLANPLPARPAASTRQTSAPNLHQGGQSTRPTWEVINITDVSQWKPQKHPLSGTSSVGACSKRKKQFKRIPGWQICQSKIKNNLEYFISRNG